MNNLRRKAIKAAIAKLEALQEDFNILKEEIENIMDEEQEAMDNVPESLQETDRYYAMEEAVDNLTYAVDVFENFDFEEITSYLEEAMN